MGLLASSPSLRRSCFAGATQAPDPLQQPPRRLSLCPRPSRRQPRGSPSARRAITRPECTGLRALGQADRPEVQAVAKAAGLGEGFTGHSGRVGMAHDLVKNGVELLVLMTAGRWKSSKMPARYTERQTAGELWLGITKSSGG